jgi:hypothetical protein
VHVGGGGGILAVQDLGGEVTRGAEQPAGLRQPRVLGEPGQSEVDEHGGTPLEQHVGRLDVAVQHADTVHGDQRLHQGGREEDEVATGDRTVLADVLVQREPRHVAGGHEGGPAPRVGVDHLGDPWARDAPQRGDLTRQPGPGLVVPDHVLTKNLQGDPRPVRGLCQVHDAHAALADAGEQAVPADEGLAGAGPAESRGRLLVHLRILTRPR